MDVVIVEMGIGDLPWVINTQTGEIGRDDDPNFLGFILDAYHAPLLDINGKWIGVEVLYFCQTADGALFHIDASIPSKDACH